MLNKKFKAIKKELRKQEKSIKDQSFRIKKLKRAIKAAELREKLWNLELDRMMERPRRVFKARHDFTCPNYKYIDQERAMLLREFEASQEAAEIEASSSESLSKQSVSVCKILSTIADLNEDLNMLDVKDAFEIKPLPAGSETEDTNDLDLNLNFESLYLDDNTNGEPVPSQIIITCSHNPSFKSTSEYCFATQQVDPPPDAEVPQEAVQSGENEPEVAVVSEQAEVTQQPDSIGVSFNLETEEIGEAATRPSTPPLRTSCPSSASAPPIHTSSTIRTRASQKIQIFFKRYTNLGTTPSGHPTPTPPVNLFKSMPLLNNFEEGNDISTILPAPADPTAIFDPPTSTFVPNPSVPAASLTKVDPPPVQVPVTQPKPTSTTTLSIVAKAPDPIAKSSSKDPVPPKQSQPSTQVQTNPPTSTSQLPNHQVK